MRTLILTFACMIALPALAQQQVTAPPWQVTVGKIGADAIIYDGAALAKSLRLSGYAPEWKGARFDMGGAAVATSATGASWKKQAPGNQDVSLEVSLKGNTCLITCDTTITRAGPTEFSLDLQPGALAAADNVARIVLDGKPQSLDLGGKFSHINVVKEVRFEQPERSIVLRCEGFHIQDRRDREQGLFLVAVLNADGREPKHYEKTIEITIEPADPATFAMRKAYLSQSEYERKDLPVPNGGFEEGLEKWSSNPRATVDTQVKHGGKQSARITIPATQTDATGIYLVQNVPAVEGKLYQVTAWVKSDDVKGVTLGDKSPTGVTAIVEFADKEGKWLASGDYASGLYGTKDWTQISTDACRAPEKAGFAIIFLSLRGTGTGWFDDITVTEVTQHVVLETPGEQTTLADNTPRFAWSIKAPGTMTLELAPSPDFPADKTQRFADLREKTFSLAQPIAPGQWYWRVLAPVARATSAVWSFKQTAPVTADCTDPVIAPDHAFLPKSDQKVTVGVTDNVGVTKIKLTLDGYDITKRAKLVGKQIELLPAVPWKAGLHRLQVEAWDAAGNHGERVIYLTHAKGLVEKKWLPQGGIAFDGKPKFMLGMYGVRIEDMPEVAKGGYDFCHAYNWDGAGDNASALEYLDECKKNGLQAFIGFNRGALQANDFNFVAERIGALMQHPALLAWYLFDEPDLPHQYVSPDQLRGLYNLIHTLDPSRPVIVTVAQRHMMPDYRDSYDVYWSMDYSTPAANVRNFEYHRSKLQPGVPIMSIVHCYDGKQRGAEADPAKFWPDPATMHAAAFMAIAHESSGLCWWWWGQGGTNFLTVANVPAAWEGLKRTVAQINALKPVLAAQAPAGRGASVRMWIEQPAEDQEVHCWEKKLADRTVIIAVNRDPKACQAKIASPLLKAGAVKVLFEDRTITAEAGSLADGFEALGVHVYEIR